MGSSKSKNAKRRQLGEQTRAILTTLFPKCFVQQGTTQPKRPLALNVYSEILKRCPDLTPEAVSAALRDYTAGVKFAVCNIVGAIRVDLDGNDAGIVTVSQDEYAAARAMARSQTDQLLHRIRVLESAKTLWACYVRGPADLIPTPDYESAVGVADTINNNDPNKTLRAVPMLWPGSADEHAIAINAGADEYEWATQGQEQTARAA